ncbi:hypothetical protein Bbelb_290790 [Branchiostoma belcheri]|nr:hypothetical protein Bbelb_290790 [Branchiostoma belcheri]
MCCHLSALSKCFQQKNLDLTEIQRAVEAKKEVLRLAREEPLDQHLGPEGRLHGMDIQEFAVLRRQFVDFVMENLEDRFPQMDLLSAFSFLDPSHLPVANGATTTYGKERILAKPRFVKQTQPIGDGPPNIKMEGNDRQQANKDNITRPTNLENTTSSANVVRTVEPQTTENVTAFPKFLKRKTERRITVETVTVAADGHRASESLTCAPNDAHLHLPEEVRWVIRARFPEDPLQLADGFVEQQAAVRRRGSPSPRTCPPQAHWAACQHPLQQAVFSTEHEILCPPVGLVYRPAVSQRAPASRSPNKARRPPQTAGTEVRAALDRYGVEDSGHRHLHKAVDMAPPTTASLRVRVTRPNGTLLASAEEWGRQGTAVTLHVQDITEKGRHHPAFGQLDSCPTERRNSGQSRDQNQARTELVPRFRSRFLGICLHEERVAGMQKPIGQQLQVRQAPEAEKKECSHL